MNKSLKNAAADIYSRVFCRQRLYPLNRALFHLSARGLGFYNMDFRISGERYFIERVVSRPLFRTVLDVGAHHGEYATVVARANPTATIHSFEPHPKSFAKLVAATAGTRIQPHAMGLGRSPGRATLYDVADWDGSALATVHEQAVRRLTDRLTTHDVEISTLDAFVEARGIAHVDLLKVDVEGNELEVLAGATQSLARRAIGTVQFEFNEMNVVSRAFMRDFHDVLRDFRFFRLVQDGMVPLDPYSPFYSEVFGFQNVVAIRHDLVNEVSR